MISKKDEVRILVFELEYFKQLLIAVDWVKIIAQAVNVGFIIWTGGKNDASKIFEKLHDFEK